MGQCYCYDKAEAEEYQYINTIKGGALPPIQSPKNGEFGFGFADDASFDLSKQYDAKQENRNNLDLSISSMEQQNLITVQTTQKKNGQRGGGGGMLAKGGDGIKKMYNSKSRSLESTSKFNNFEDERNDENAVGNGNNNNGGVSRKMMQRGGSPQMFYH